MIEEVPKSDSNYVPPSGVNDIVENVNLRISDSLSSADEPGTAKLIEAGNPENIFGALTNEEKSTITVSQGKLMEMLKDTLTDVKIVDTGSPIFVSTNTGTAGESSVVSLSSPEFISVSDPELVVVSKPSLVSGPKIIVMQPKQLAQPEVVGSVSLRVEGGEEATLDDQVLVSSDAELPLPDSSVFQSNSLGEATFVKSSEGTPAKAEQVSISDPNLLAVSEPEVLSVSDPEVVIVNQPEPIDLIISDPVVADTPLLSDPTDLGVPLPTIGTKSLDKNAPKLKTAVEASAGPSKVASISEPEVLQVNQPETVSVSQPQTIGVPLPTISTNSLTGNSAFIRTSVGEPGPAEFVSLSDPSVVNVGQVEALSISQPDSSLTTDTSFVLPGTLTGFSSQTFNRIPTNNVQQAPIAQSQPFTIRLEDGEDNVSFEDLGSNSLENDGAIIQPGVQQNLGFNIGSNNVGVPLGAVVAQVDMGDLPLDNPSIREASPSVFPPFSGVSLQSAQTK